jgi:hypothetical protein
MIMLRRLFSPLRIFVANCREQTDLSSLEVDGQLSWLQKLGCRFHRKNCPECAKYRDHLDTIRTLAKGLDPQAIIAASKPAHDQAAPMPPDVRQRLTRRMS